MLYRLPFGVETRADKRLLHNLAARPCPILFEGLQTTYFAHHPALRKQYKYLRLHNMESDYYKGSAKSINSFFKRVIYQLEAWKYKGMEEDFSLFEHVYCLSLSETKTVAQRGGNAEFVPPFVGLDEVVNLSEFGQGVIYYGDLRLPDNQRAVLFLIEVMSELTETTFTILAETCPEEIQNELAKYSHMSHKMVQGIEELKVEWAKAHVHLLWSFQQSGTKLKALNALYCGRHVVMNENLVDDPQLQALGYIVSDLEQARKTVRDLLRIPYLQASHRTEVLNKQYSDIENAERIINTLRFPLLESEKRR